MNKRISIISVAVVLALIASIWLFGRSDSRERHVNIAANLPMSGPLATYGVAVREGAVLALEHLRSQGATSDLSIDWQDNASDPRMAVSILQKQLLRNPSIYISGVKPQTMAIKDEVSGLGIPHFVWIFDVSINQGTENNFRTWVSYKLEPQVFFDYATARNAHRVAITYVQLPHTIEAYEGVLVPSLKQNGIEVLVLPFDFGRTDFRDIAVRMNAFQPDLFILNGFQGDLVGLVRSLRPLGAINDGNTIATYDFLDAANILGSDEKEGIRVVAPLFETRPTSPRIAEFREAFIGKFRRQPLYTHAFAYDMLMAINEARAALGENPTSAEWMQAIRSVDVDGVTGPIRFDDQGDLITPLEVGVYRDGKLIPDLATKE